MPFFLLVHIALIALLAPHRANDAAAAAIAAADRHGEYVGRMLDRINGAWAYPQGIRGDFAVNLRISLDARGKVLHCKPTKTSGLEAFDRAACGAVLKAAPFGDVPDNAPLEVFLAYRIGKPDGVSADERKTLAIQEADLAERRILARAGQMLDDGHASLSLERARERALHAAERTGRTLPEIKPQPAAPPARQKTPPPSAAKRKSRLAGLGEADEDGGVLIGGGPASGMDASDGLPGKAVAPALQKETSVASVSEEPRPEPQATGVGSSPDRSESTEEAREVQEQAKRAPPSTGEGVALPALPRQDAGQSEGENASAGQGDDAAEASLREAEKASAEEMLAREREKRKKDNPAWANVHDTYVSDIGKQLAAKISRKIGNIPEPRKLVVHLKVNAEGKMERCLMLSSSGDPLFDRRVLQAMAEIGDVEPPPMTLGNAFDVPLTLEAAKGASQK